jgi:hypothetical protein
METNTISIPIELFELPRRQYPDQYQEKRVGIRLIVAEFDIFV